MQSAAYSDLSPQDAAQSTLDGTLPYEETWRVNAEALLECITALQTCLHQLGEEGYLPDPDYPEIQDALTLFERMVGVKR